MRFYSCTPETVNLAILSHLVAFTLYCQITTRRTISSSPLLSHLELPSNIANFWGRRSLVVNHSIWRDARDFIFALNFVTREENKQ